MTACVKSAFLFRLVENDLEYRDLHDETARDENISGKERQLGDEKRGRFVENTA
jgi:hypothetical protein